MQYVGTCFVAASLASAALHSSSTCSVRAALQNNKDGNECVNGGGGAIKERDGKVGGVGVESTPKKKKKKRADAQQVGGPAGADADEGGGPGAQKRSKKNKA